MTSRLAFHVVFAAFAALGGAWRSAAAQEVVVRRGMPAVVEPVLGVGIDGVLVGASREVEGRRVPWDMVASVQGRFASDAALHAAAAEASWRARTRLERGDLAGAEPLFESLQDRYAGRSGAMAQLVTGGLLLCRVSRGANTLAVEPFLSYLEACEGDPSPRLIVRGGDASDPTDLTPIDEATRLNPSLPPMWLATPAVQTSLRLAPRARTGRAAVLGELYRVAMQAEAGTAAMPPEPANADDAVRLVWEVVAARAGDGATRAAARQRLRLRVAAEPAPPPWVAAWCRCAIGRSLLREGDEESRMLAVAELLAIPATLEHASPYVTGVAMADAALAMAASGDLRGANAVRRRLADRFPGHPALDFEPLRRLPASSPATAAAAKEATP
jgi:hypothetical protein